MKKYLQHFRRLWLRPLVTIAPLTKSISGVRQYINDWLHYTKIPSAESVSFLDSAPCLFDRTATTPFDSHYFYQSAWASTGIYKDGASIHVDVGSDIIFMGMLTSFTKVIFVDIRPLIVNLENYYPNEASILALPFSSNSIVSLSCLHVAEHIGLGRYGDELDPAGTKKTASELSRVLAPGGHLYFSVPVGKPRVCFNAHRIHSPQQILDYFCDLDLVEFSGVNDQRQFIKSIKPNDLSNANYACGLFHFIK